ncbi:hypothetical protein Vau01_106020 [Virgisporangium aurantiacum]|uniref:Glycosyltransferase 2-like domain-containing protein n=1 Tax=Virgisporangium aurantiacum TaxID=175570 RepID=A0A8J4E661_9ACTN|nr:hypothetical protein Vau01_106020 [Virgisporangium aurantiacum]
MIDGHGVTVLISSRNRPGLLADAVASVLEGSVRPDEIIVVDQSEEPNQQLAEMSPPIGVAFRYLHSDTVGISRSRNAAFSAASHPVVVVTDDDCLVDRAWLRTIVQSLIKAGDRAVITGRVLAGPAEEEGAFALSLHADEMPAEYTGQITVDPLATFNMAMWASTFAEVGSFDSRIGPGTRFPSSEDNDYGYRLLLAGYRIVFDPDAVVHHRSWRTGRNYVSVRYSYGRGQGGYYGKHLASRDWFMLVKAWHALRRRGHRMRQGDPRAILGEFAWIGGWAVGIGDWLLRPARRDERYARSDDGSRGW